MGASPHLRWVAIAATALWLAAAAPAVAQSPSGPDAAPSSGSSHGSGGGPSPDPAPVKSKPAVVKRAVVPAAAVTSRTPVQSTPAPTVTTPAAKATVKKTATHRKKPVRRKHRAATPPKPHRTVAVHAPSLPRLTPVRLVAPTTHGDASRARKLAAGALSLLVLSLASAMLLAVAARGERRRVVR
jgi:hypothetical protein